jgi:transcriptional regulator with XRE-family HTH domain
MQSYNLFTCTITIPDSIKKQPVKERREIPVWAFCEMIIQGKLPRPAKYPKELMTIADHLRKRRYDLKLSRLQVAKIIGVSTETITNWENERKAPQIKFFPKIIEFLGYNPYRIDISTQGGRIKFYRYQKGLSQRGLAKLLRVESSTIKTWEKNECEPRQNNLKRLTKYLEILI